MRQLSIGEIYTKLRSEYGEGQRKESQKDMADKIGVSRSMISHIEKYNSVPKDEVLQKTAFHYGKDEWERDFLLRSSERPLCILVTRKVFKAS